MPLTIPGVTVEGFEGSFSSFIFGRGVDSNINSSPSIVLPNTAGIYSIFTPIDLTYPPATSRNVTGYQVIFGGKRAYGWTFDDLMVGTDASSNLVLASTNQFSSSLSVLSRALIVTIGGITKVLFSYAGTLKSVTTATGVSIAFIPNAATTRVTACLPLVVNTKELALAFDLPADSTRADIYKLRPTLIAATTSAVTTTTYGIYTYDPTEFPNPALFAAQVKHLSNPYQDPPNQLNSIMITTPTGTTGTVSGGSTINVRIGAVAYPIFIPYYFWVLFALAIIILILFIIVLVVARSKTIKYVPTKKVVRTATRQPIVQQRQVVRPPPLR